MGDRAIIIDLIGKAFDETGLDGESFADVLREEADRYEEAPEQARNPNRVVGYGGTDDE